jgi:hypothetical protein
MRRIKMKQEKGKKVIPRYWWKFRWERNKIAWLDVKSDNDLYPVVKSYNVENKEHADFEIELAQKLIEDLNAGRIDPGNA